MKELNAAEFLAQFRQGHMNNYVSQELNALTQAAERLQRPGELTIKIKLKPKNQGEVETSIQCTTKMPRRDTMTAIMFSTPEGVLVDRDPNQRDMFIEAKAVPDAADHGVRIL